MSSLDRTLEAVDEVEDAAHRLIGVVKAGANTDQETEDLEGALDRLAEIRDPEA